MNSYSDSQTVERAQPWLGTVVSIRVEGIAQPAAHRAIDAAFEEIATIHRLMSFHDAASDVSRLNRDGFRRPVTLDPRTFEVLQCAMHLSLCSKGCFDVTVGAELVAWEFLPPPVGAEREPEGSWRDIELMSGNRVVFHRPLWIDLGGIAKGFAVDRATECLRICGALRTVVNAGGEIRVQGENPEPIRLSVESSTDTMPVLELAEGSVASSSGQRQRHWHDGRLCGPHVDGCRRTPVSPDRFVCVVAESCIIADALTKVVMAQGEDSVELLRQFAATAYTHDPASGWQYLDTGRTETE